MFKKWPEQKSIRDIQVFLGFANFYWQFIQGSSKIVALFTSILKTTGSPNVSRLEVINSNAEGVEFGIGNDSKKLAKKSEKLSKGKKPSKS